METEEKKLTSSEIDQMLEEAAAYHVESKEPSNKNKKNKSERKSILDEINKSHSEIRLNNDIKLQNYYKNIIEKVS